MPSFAAGGVRSGTARRAKRYHRGRMGKLPLLLSIGLASACGEAGMQVDDWVPDDIDEQATLDAIGAAGYARLCGAFSDYVHDQYRSSYLVQAVCTAEAIRSTTDAVACAASIETCLETLPPNVQAELDMILAQASCPTVGVDPDGCPSTVSSLTACLDELGGGLEDLQFGLTCAAAGQPVPPDWYLLAIPDECRQLQMGCPTPG